MNREALAEAMCDFFRCPNNGRVIDGMKHDDKVMCACGRSNPKARNPEGITGGIVHHAKVYLERATAREWIEQKDSVFLRKLTEAGVLPQARVIDVQQEGDVLHVRFEVPNYWVN